MECGLPARVEVLFGGLAARTPNIHSYKKIVPGAGFCKKPRHTPGLIPYIYLFKTTILELF